MASEMRKNVKLFGDQDATSQQRDLRGDTQDDGGEDQVAPLAEQSPISLLREQGRNDGSMNMDEFMTNIWNAEEFQATTSGFMEDAETAVMGAAGGRIGGAGEGGPYEQGSFSLPPPLSRTMDEVWDGINQKPPHAQASPWLLVQPQPQLGNGGVEASGQQELLGYMTLEDFLVKAGVVRGSLASQLPMPISGLVPGTMNPLTMKQQPGQPGPMLYPVPPANAMYPVTGDDKGFPGGYDGGMVVVPPPPVSQGTSTEVSTGLLNGMSALTQADMTNCTWNGAMVENSVRKRCTPEDWSSEKSMDLPYCRMIKNRDSAARSRARKKAYTMELESELIHLKEENARLKAEEKMILLAKIQMLVEKMMEQSKENVNAKKGGRSRHSGSCMW